MPILFSVLRWVGWNAFLALIPVGMAYLLPWLLRPSGRRRAWGTALAAPVALIWFFFLPNTCYLLTEWRHFLMMLARTDTYEQWAFGRDSGAMVLLIGSTLFFLAYSLFGVVTFALAVRPVARLASRRIRPLWWLAIPFFMLMSLGVYLGLVLRFNSWDLLHRPGIVWLAGLDAISRPALAAVILLFAAFLWGVYLVMDIWFDGLLLRLGRLPTSTRSTHQQTGCVEE